MPSSSTPPNPTKQLDDTVKTPNPAAQPTAEFPPPSSLTVSGSSPATRAQVDCNHWSQQLPALASKLNVQRHCNIRRILHRRLYRRRRRRRRRHRRRRERSKGQKETCLAERLAKAMNSRVPDCEIRGTNKVQMPGRCITTETLHHTTTRWIKTLRRCMNKMVKVWHQSTTSTSTICQRPPPTAVFESRRAATATHNNNNIVETHNRASGTRLPRCSALDGGQ